MANEETQRRTNRLEVVDRSYHSASVYYRQRQTLAWSQSNVVEVFPGQNDSSVVTLAVVRLETKRWRAANGARRSADQQNKYCTELDRKHLTSRKRKCFSPSSVPLLIKSLAAFCAGTSGRSFTSGRIVTRASASSRQQQRRERTEGATLGCKQRPLLNS